MHIKDIMTRPVTTAPLDANLNEVARLMWEADRGVIPIVDNDGRIAGIVTDRDICMAAYTQGKLLQDIPVTTAMAREVVTAQPNADVEQVERLMRGAQVRRIPIVDAQRRPVGIVALNDLARQAARTHRSSVDREVLLTVAAICQPHAHLDLGHMDHSTGSAISG
jgi:CBS domain-containing protein